MSQKTLGLKIGKSREMVARYETDRDDVPLDILNKIAETLHVRLGWLLDGSGIKEGSVSITGDALEEATAELPYWGEVPAGQWARPEDHVMTIPVDKTLAKAGRLVVTVAGDSMYPRLHHGDEVIVQTSATPKEGVISLARNNEDDVTLKVLKHVNGKPWELRPINPDHDTPTAERWELIGYVVSIKRHFGPNRYLLEVDELGVRP